MHKLSKMIVRGDAKQLMIKYSVISHGAGRVDYVVWELRAKTPPRTHPSGAGAEGAVTTARSQLAPRSVATAYVERLDHRTPRARA